MTSQPVYDTLVSQEQDQAKAWPRLLILAPFAANRSAAHGGARVLGQMLAHLARRHPLALCYLRAPGEATLEPALGKLCERVEEVLLPAAGEADLAGKLRTWQQVLGGLPLWAYGRSSKAFSERVSDLLETWPPELIQLEYHIMGQYLPVLRQYSAPRVLVQYEPGECAARERWLKRTAAGRLLPLLDLLAWKRFEPAVVRQSQAVVVFTERDRRVMAAIQGHPPLFRIPFGAEIPAQGLNPLGAAPNSILFAGSFDHAPNIDAARRLVKHIFPAVQAQLPAARLVIVGANPPLDLQQAAGTAIQVTGYVPDVRPYMDEAAVIAAPLRQGGGMRVKVVEALAAGKAVVATRLASEGLDVTDGQELILAENDMEFSQAILQLLQNANRRAAIARQARTWASENLAWDAVLNAYERLYQSFRNA